MPTCLLLVLAGGVHVSSSTLVIFYTLVHLSGWSRSNVYIPCLFMHTEATACIYGLVGWAWTASNALLRSGRSRRWISRIDYRDRRALCSIERMPCSPSPPLKKIPHLPTQILPDLPNSNQDQSLLLRSTDLLVLGSFPRWICFCISPEPPFYSSLAAAAPAPACCSSSPHTACCLLRLRRSCASRPL